MRGLLTVLALAGCRQVFGLEPPMLAEPDAGGTAVSGRYMLRYLYNNAAHEPIVDEAPIEFTATVKLDDGTNPPVTLLGNGDFEFTTPTPGEHYRVLLEASGYTPLEVDHTASTLALFEMRAGRLGGTVAASNTQLAYQLSDVITGGSLQLFTTGSFMTTTRPSDPAPVFDWPALTTLNGLQPTLVEAQAHDRIYLLYLTPQAGVSTLERYRADDIDVANGVQTVVTGPTLPIEKPACVDARVMAATEVQRLDAAGYSSPTTPWQVTTGALVYPTLAIGFQNGALAMLRNLDPPQDMRLSTFVGSPVPGTLLQYLTIVRSYSIRAGSAGTPIGVMIGTAHYIGVDSTCSTSPLLGGEVEPPGVPRIDDMRLEVDRDITIDRSRDLTVSWPPLVSGSLERTRIELYEVGDGALRPLRQFLTTSDHILVDNTLLQTGKYYVLRIGNATGWTGAQRGDFGAFTAPFANAVRLSAVFRVTN